MGVYTYELKVTDNKGATAKSTVKVTVNEAANVLPVAKAGVGQTITLPLSQVTLSGSGVDTDGTIASYSWAKISGPSSYKIENGSSAATVVSRLAAGAYQFELKVTDNKGATATSTVQVRVNEAANIAPVAQAGYDRTIQYPKNSIVLPGSGKDEDGKIVSYLWTKVSGPTGGTIIDPSAAQTGVNDLKVGVYTYQLTVTDNKGAIGKSTLKVTVNAVTKNAFANSNIPPEANAGFNRVVELPKNSIVLAGSGSDKDGSVVSYLWTKISGPSAGTIIDASSAQAGVNNLVPGVYQYQLKVTDNNGATGLSSVTVTVNKGKSGNGSFRSAKVSAEKEATSVSLMDVTKNESVPVNAKKKKQKAVLASIKFYPNPVQDVASLEINTAGLNTKVRIVMSNISGKTIFTKELGVVQNNVKEAINISNYVNGVYFITILFDGIQQQSIKVIKL